MKNSSQTSGIPIGNIVIGIFMTVGLFFLINVTNKNSSTLDNANEKTTSKVEIENGKQIVNIKAKVGYSPSVSIAKADTPTILRITTAGTFDCSAALTIPSLKIRKNLPATGTTDIEIPNQKAGNTLNGTCSMGMYNFSIKFI